jgi:hypothetical protein
MRPSNKWNGCREGRVCASHHSTVQVRQRPFDTILQSFFAALVILAAPIKSIGTARTHEPIVLVQCSNMYNDVQYYGIRIMTYEEVCELALALGVWLESIATAPAVNQPPVALTPSPEASGADSTP